MVSFTVIIASIVISIVVTIGITLCCRFFSDYIEIFIISIPESLSENITKLRDTEGKIRAMNHMEKTDWLSKVERTLEEARLLLLREYSSSEHNNDSQRSYFCFGYYDCWPIKLKRQVKHLIVEGQGIIAASAKAARRTPGIPSVGEGTTSLHQTVEHTCDVADIEKGTTVEEPLELREEQIRPHIEEGGTVDEALELEHTGGVTDSEEGKLNINTNAIDARKKEALRKKQEAAQKQQGAPASKKLKAAASADNNEVPPTGQVTRTPNLRKFEFAELGGATRNFRPDTMLGEGGFGSVFKGWVDEKSYAPSKVGIGMPVAVKMFNLYRLPGPWEWQAVVEFLGKFSHPNLVKLLGYCREDMHFLLVYEYMQKGSLQNHLFRRGAEPLSWEIRLKIAIGAARGLAFLHNSEKWVIFRNFKPSNILLDEEFNAKLSDFGLAKLGPTNESSYVTTRVMGTYGYAAPEYIATGRLYIKSDVYGFGVVLLQLLTGLHALDPNGPSGLQTLVEWAKPSLSDKRKLKKIIDPRLENQYPSKAAGLLAKLSRKCVEGDPKNRPSMEEVLRDLERIYLIKEKPKETKGNNASSSSQQGSKSQRGHENRKNSSLPPIW